MTGFKMGKLPFKYLGVPISFKRIGLDGCVNLVEKMTTRVRCYSSRKLAYQRRLILVNSVLLSVHILGLGFCLTKEIKVVKEVENIYRYG